MIWLIIYRAMQWLCALLVGCAVIALFTQGIAYLLWIIAGMFLFFGFKQMGDDVKEELL